MTRLLFKHGVNLTTERERKMELTCSNRLSIIRLHPGVSGTIFARGHLYPRLLYSFTRCSSVMEVTVSGERRVASMRFLIILNSLLISYESGV